MTIDDAIRILSDQIAYWEDGFSGSGKYPNDYSPELSDAMETVIEVYGKEEV